jgi:hypothetical protein
MSRQFDLYLAGPMTGIANFNHPAFHTAAAALREVGYVVFNPAENEVPADAPWPEHMRVDIANLVECHHLATLPGVEHSKGAQLELHIAKQLDMRIASVNEWLLMQETTEAAQ